MQDTTTVDLADEQKRALAGSAAAALPESQPMDTTAAAADTVTPPARPVVASQPAKSDLPQSLSDLWDMAKGYAHRVVSGEPDQTLGQRVGEVARSVPRGVVGAEQSIIDTGKDVISALDPSEGHKISKAVNSALDVARISEETEANIFGGPSRDALASLVEGVTQFATSWYLTKPLQAAEGATMAAKVASAAARGAAVDFAGFDPRAGGLADMVNMIPSAGVRAAAQAFMVNPDDSQLFARFKRAAAGVIPGVTIETIGHVVRGGAAEAHGNMAAAGKEYSAVGKIVSGTHDQAGVVRVVPGENGWSLEANHSVSSVADHVAAEAHPNGPPKVTYANRADAEVQAHIINQGVDARIKAMTEGGALTADQIDVLKAHVETLAQAEPKTLHQMLAQMNEQGIDVSPAADVSELFQKVEHAARVLDDANVMGRWGNGQQVPHALQMDLASQLLSQIPEQYHVPVMSQVLKEGSLNAIGPKVFAGNQVLSGLKTAIQTLGDQLTMRPEDRILQEQFKLGVRNYALLQHRVGEMSSKLGLGLNAVQATQGTARAVEGQAPEALAKGLGEAATPAPKGTLTSPHEIALDKAIMSSTPEYLDLYNRMFRLAGDGEVNVLATLPKVIEITRREGANISGRVGEALVNAMLAKTGPLRKMLVGGTVTTLWNNAGRALGGSLHGDVGTFASAMNRTMADGLWVKDNIKSAFLAFKMGYSVMDPPSQIVRDWGGWRDEGVKNLLSSESFWDNAKGAAQTADNVAGGVVRIPGRFPSFGHEFIKATNYRAAIADVSKVYWEGKGLSGPTLWEQVNKDVDAGFDPVTGQATIPRYLKEARVAALSNPFEPGSEGAAIQSWRNSSALGRVVVPFFKTGAMMFRYLWAQTPVLNMLQKEARETLMQWDTPASMELQGRTIMSGILLAAMYHMAESGKITGTGPANPELRGTWRLKNEPDSFQGPDGQWHSYAGLEPSVAGLMSLAADAQMIHAASPEDGDQLAIAIGSGLTHNLLNKSFFESATGFLDAMMDDTPGATKITRYVQRTLSSVVPGVLQQFGPDTTVREIKSLKEALMARIPGLSDKVPAKYDLFSNPVTGQPNGVMNLNKLINPVPAMGPAVQDPAVDSLIAMGRAFPPPKREVMPGIDLADPAFLNQKTGRTAWDRFNEVIRTGAYGDKGLEAKIKEYVKGPDWKMDDSGNPLNPGGERYQQVTRLIQESRRDALETVRSEVPALDKALDAARDLQRSGRHDTKQGVDSAIADALANHVNVKPKQ